MDFLPACGAPLVDCLSTILGPHSNPHPESQLSVAHLSCANIQAPAHDWPRYPYIHAAQPVFVSSTVTYPSPPPTGSEAKRHVPLPQLSPVHDRSSCPHRTPLPPIMEHEEPPPVPPPQGLPSPPSTQPLPSLDLPDSRGEGDLYPLDSPALFGHPIVTAQDGSQSEGVPHRGLRAPLSTGWDADETLTEDAGGPSTLFGTGLGWDAHRHENFSAGGHASSMLGLCDADDDSLPLDSPPASPSQKSRFMSLHPAGLEDDRSSFASSSGHSRLWDSENTLAGVGGSSFPGMNHDAFVTESLPEPGPQHLLPWHAETETTQSHTHSREEDNYLLEPWHGINRPPDHTSVAFPPSLSFFGTDHGMPVGPVASSVASWADNSLAPTPHRPWQAGTDDHHSHPWHGSTQSHDAACISTAGAAGARFAPRLPPRPHVPVTTHPVPEAGPSRLTWHSHSHPQPASERHPPLHLNGATDATPYSWSSDRSHLLRDSDEDRTPGTLAEAMQRSPLFYPQDWLPRESATLLTSEPETMDADGMEVDIEHPSPGASSLFSSLSGQSSQSSAFGLHTPTDSEFNLFTISEGEGKDGSPQLRHPTFFFDEDDQDELAVPASPARRGSFLALDDLDADVPAPASPSRRSSLPELEMDPDSDPDAEADARSDTPFAPDSIPGPPPPADLLTLAADPHADPFSSPALGACLHMQTPSPSPLDLPSSGLLLLPGSGSGSPPPEDALLRELPMPADLDPDSELSSRSASRGWRRTSSTRGRRRSRRRRVRGTRWRRGASCRRS
jgi:hypothetical protein